MDFFQHVLYVFLFPFQHLAVKNQPPNVETFHQTAWKLRFGPLAQQLRLIVGKKG